MSVKSSTSSSSSSSSSSSLKKLKWGALDKVVETFVTRLKRREIRGSSAVATNTAELLRTIVSRAQFEDVGELMDTVRLVGRKLQLGNPMELCIGNIARRVLYIIRQETAHLLKVQKANKQRSDEAKQYDVGGVSLHKLLDEPAQSDVDLAKQSSEVDMVKLKQPICEEITELIDEIKNVRSQISELAVEHIHAKETILTFGLSRTVIEFLKEAAKLREFQVYVCESNPSFSGQTMALKLAQEVDVMTTCITDSAVYAIMPTVNKVIIGTHAVMADGSLVCYTGGRNITEAAKAHSVPVVVVVGLYKLCPLYADENSFNTLQAPSEILRFEQALIDKVNVENPAYDYIPPDLVSLYVTNFGGHNPSYIYRLLAEYYDPEDYEL